MADLNGDGVKDGVVVNLSSGDVSVLLGNGDGTFEPAVNYAVGPNPTSVVVNDFNGGGTPDLAVANGVSVRVLLGNGDGTFRAPGAVSVLLGNGDGSFQSPLAFGAGFDPMAIGLGDFNGDGKPDLAVVDASVNNLSVMLNTCPAN